MHKRLPIGVFFIMASFCTAVYAGSDIDFEEGMWEISSQVKMQGMDMPAQTFTQCITKDNMVPQNDQPSPQGGGSCKISDVKTVGNTVTWSVVCKTGGGEMKGKGKITYQRDRFKGESTSEMMGMQMVTEMSGKRIGPCK